MTQHAFAVPRDANFTEEQHSLAEVAGDLFASANPPARLRSLWDQPAPRERAVWQQLAQMGLTSIGVPEQHGGMGGSAADLAMVLEAAGRTLLPEPLAVTVAVAVPVLVAAGEDVAAQWLPKVASGQAVGALSLTGSPYVLDVDEADFVLVERENTLWLDGAAVDAVRVRSEDGSRRTFRRPELRGEMIGGSELLEQTRLRAIAATAAELVGVSAAILDACVEYARVRKQFDTSIGAFQAVQHILADLFVAVESARGASRHAARMLGELSGTPAPAEVHRAVSIAKAAAARSHRKVNTDALQVFGGIGFTWEHDLHLWLKRGLALEAQHGNERHHRRAIAEHLFKGTPS